MGRSNRESINEQAQRSGLAVRRPRRLVNRAAESHGSMQCSRLPGDAPTASFSGVAASAAADRFNRLETASCEYDRDAVGASRFSCDERSDLLHQLANILTSVIMNAQMLEWKLPAYSHLKRPLRELERSAQRGGELVKQLMRRAGEGPADQPFLNQVDSQVTASAVVAIEEPGGMVMRAGSPPHRVASATAPDFFVAPVRHLTTECDPCTSSFFPKRDDGSGR
jgi:hypothetical protein